MKPSGIETADTYFRLRQIALASPDLPQAIEDMVHIFGVRVAYQDPHVRKYGLENALFPFGLNFIEVVAPVEEGTAAGRFMERSGGVGGYMAIFNCADPERRGAHAEAMGVPIAHSIDHDGFHGVQLHPRACRAAMIEFDRTPGEIDLHGPYYPAGGEGWTHALTDAVTRDLKAVVIESSDPHGIGAHWGKLLEKPYRQEGAGGSIEVDMLRIMFVPAPAGARETLRGLVVDVVDAPGVLARAQQRGHAVTGNGFELCGVRFTVES